MFHRLRSTPPLCCRQTLQTPRSRPKKQRRFFLAVTTWALVLLLPVWATPLGAQEGTTAPSPEGTKGRGESAAVISLPEVDQGAPVVAADKPGEYVLEFNRSPVVGSSFRFTGIYDEQRIRFTRPRNWEADSVKLVLRYRHSAALYATRSNLSASLNGTKVGSVPLNQPQGEIGTATFNVPLHLLEDYNEVLITALQNNSPTCTQDPYDPSLWTEVMPDSKLIFGIVPQDITPDFSQFPYPLFDDLSLQTSQIAFLQPTEISSTGLTSLARFQAALGRLAEYRPLETRLIANPAQLQPQERLFIMGTPGQQPVLESLELPLTLDDDQFVDEKGKVIDPNIGSLMWVTPEEQGPVLVATGNSPEGVAKGVQFLVQAQDRQIGAGHVLLVKDVSPPENLDPRAWPGYIPPVPNFLLRDLTTNLRENIGDVTLRGAASPMFTFDFKALPDDQIKASSEMVLRYSYGPQVNTLTSMVEVALDGVAVEGRRLTAVEGAQEKTLKVRLPAERITPDSKIQVSFRLDPRERRSCSRVTDQQLWGTVHGDTSFTLPRENIAKLPDLKALRTGFPFTAPQDLSTTAVVLPNQPTASEVELLMETMERLGRLSRADSVLVDVYALADLPDSVRSDRNLILIGTQKRLPFPDAVDTGGFSLEERSTRRFNLSEVQLLPDVEGVARAVQSPWNPSRVVLALTAQQPKGLKRLADLFRFDSLFYQIEGDTALISAQQEQPDPYSAQDYRLEFLRQSAPAAVATTPRSRQFWRLLRSNWLFVVPAMVAITMFMYAIIQVHLRRTAQQDG